MVRPAAELGKKQRHKRNGKTKVSNSNGNEQSEDFVRDGGIALRGPCFVSVGARMHPPIYRIRRRRRKSMQHFISACLSRHGSECGGIWPIFYFGPREDYLFTVMFVYPYFYPLDCGNEENRSRVRYDWRKSNRLRRLLSLRRGCLWPSRRPLASSGLSSSSIPNKSWWCFMLLLQSSIVDWSSVV